MDYDQKTIIYAITIVLQKKNNDFGCVEIKILGASPIKSMSIKYQTTSKTANII